jgi:hypothetical protein
MEKRLRINRSIHLKYVTPETLNDVTVASYLSEGDDLTIWIALSAGTLMILMRGKL